MIVLKVKREVVSSPCTCQACGREFPSGTMMKLEFEQENEIHICIPCDELIRDHKQLFLGDQDLTCPPGCVAAVMAEYDVETSGELHFILTSVSQNPQRSA